MYPYECWKSIPGFPGYEASSEGRVRSTKRRYLVGPKIMKPGDNGQGYKYVFLAREDGTHKKYVHELVLSAFHGPRPEGYEAAHTNQVRHDNRMINLNWKSKEENTMDKVFHGSMIPDVKILAAQAMLAEKVPQKTIAESLGISPATVAKVALGLRTPAVQTKIPWILREVAARMAS